MKHANLLGTKSRFSFHFELNYLWIIIFSVGLIFLFGTFSFIQKKRIESRIASIEKIQRQIQQKRLQNEQAGQNLNQIQQQLFAKSILWSNILTDIFTSIPASVQLTSLNGTSEATKQLKLKGQTFELPNLIMLQKQLVANKGCQKVTITSFEMDTTYTFELECYLP